MKKYIFIFVALAVAVSAFAVKVPVQKSSQLMVNSDGNKFKVITWSLPTMYAVDTQAVSGYATKGFLEDTLNLVTQAAGNQWFGNSQFTLYAKFTADTDSSRVGIKIKVGPDSGAYYWPVPDSSNRAINAAGRMKQYTNFTIKTDTQYCYTAAVVSGGLGGSYLAVPLNIPAGINYKRVQVIFSCAGTALAGKRTDSTKISEAFILEKRFIP